MKRILFTLTILITSSGFLCAQLTPEVTSWVINPDTAVNKGYGGIPSNVQLVQYSTGYVYISCTCIPGYDIGPWPGNPNTPANQNFVYKITRSPQANTGALTAVGLGHVGVWTNGVSIFNASDAMTYNNDGVWHRNAYYFEGPGFDNCLGHPQQQGEYHHHVSPTCLYDATDSIHHSPLIGFMFDGYPVYGTYGYINPLDSTSGLRRIRSSYQLRNITQRDTLPDGAAASAVGPAVNSSYPLGAFMEDYKYIPGSGDLDSNNGRFCITPQYPNGTYAYFVTVDSTGSPAYPYTSGANYYGVVTASDIGMGSGHNTITESTTTYTPNASSGINELPATIKYELYPNPTKDYAFIYFDPSNPNNMKGSLYNEQGQLLQQINNLQPSISYTLDLSKYASGVYFLHLESDQVGVVEKIVKTE